MTKRFAVLSDLHCHPSSKTPQYTYLFSDGLRSPANRHPIESLLELIDQENLAGTVDAVITPGDLANQIDRQGLTSGWSFIKEIATKLNVETIISTIGNHDIDSRGTHKALSEEPFHLPQHLGPDYPVKGSESQNEFWQKGYTIVTIEDVLCLIINTTFAYKNKEKSKRGGVSTEQIEGIEESLKSLKSNKFNIAVCHHHPILHEDLNLGADDVMENGSILVKVLEKHNFSILIHGHKHHPKIQYGPGGNNALPIFASGSLSAVLTDELAQFSQNTFHIVTLSDERKGKVETWKFRLSEGWTKASYETTGIPNIAGFGNREPIESLYLSIKDWFESGKEKVVHWEKVVQKFPQVEYLVPASFIDLGQKLATDGYEMVPPPPDVPTILGILQ